MAILYGQEPRRWGTLRRGSLSVLDYHHNSLCPLSADQSVFTGDTLLAIRAPSGTRLEVPIPEVSDKCVGRVQECVCVRVCVGAGAVAGLTRLGVGSQGFDGSRGSQQPKEGSRY